MIEGPGRGCQSSLDGTRGHKAQKLIGNIQPGGGVYLSVRADIEMARLASERAATGVLWRMGRGRAGLRMIATSAVFVGSMGTVFGIVYAFRAPMGEKTAALARINWDLSQAMFPTGAGLLIAIFAWCGGRYLRMRLDIIETEMRAIILEIMNLLRVALVSAKGFG